MGYTKRDIIELALRESKDFSKEMRKYLYEISTKRQLTVQEKNLYEITHQIHIRTNDALLILSDNNKLCKEINN